MPADRLESLITAGRLLQMAREGTYARGAEYARDGRVRDLALVDGILAARVDGTETYRVRLFRQGEALEFDCTCPVGNELRFCKHCVAAGLAWLVAQGEPVDESGSADGEGAENPLDRIRAVLDGMDAAELRALLLAQARVDDALRERLLLREAARAAADRAAA